MSLPTALDQAATPGMAGKSALVLAMDIDPAIEDQFNAWYTHEHLHERMGLPGFNRGTRWIRSDGTPARGQKYLTIYEADSAEVFTSQAYLKALDNPTPWTRRMVGAFQNSLRTVTTVAASAGTVIGRELSIVELRAADLTGLVTWFQQVAVPQAFAQPDNCGMHLLTPDEAATSAKASTREGQVVTDQVPQQLLILHGTHGTAEALHRIVAKRPPAADADPDSGILTYSFYCALLG